MSIFESIQAAEKKAEEIRAQATQEVNELLIRLSLKEERVKLLYAEAPSEEKINAEIEQKVLEKPKK